MTMLFPESLHSEVCKNSFFLKIEKKIILYTRLVENDIYLKIEVYIDWISWNDFIEIPY